MIPTERQNICRHLPNLATIVTHWGKKLVRRCICSHLYKKSRDKTVSESFKLTISNCKNATNIFACSNTVADNANGFFRITIATLTRRKIRPA